MSKNYLISMVANSRTLWRYKNTFGFLWKKRGRRAAANFLFVKLFVEQGEGNLGLAFKIFEPMFRFYRPITSKIVPYPRNVEIEITTICNKTCILCEHTYWARKEKNKSLTFAEFKKIVGEFPDLKWVNLTGEGDAFLNREYLDMIRYLKAQDVVVYLVDSFDLIKPEIGEELIGVGVEGIYISFDAATRETYEYIKAGCNFDRSLANIKALIEHKERLGSPIPELCFRFIISTLNYQEMPQFIDLIESLGGKHMLGNTGYVEFVGLLSFKEVEQYCFPHVPPEIICNTLERARRAQIRVAFSHAGEQNLPMEFCRAWFEPYIMIGGYVLPCCAVLQNNDRDSLRQYCFGNILEQPFKEIWNSSRYKKLRELIPLKNAPVPILCKGCRGYDTKERERLYGFEY